MKKQEAIDHLQDVKFKIKAAGRFEGKKALSDKIDMLEDIVTLYIQTPSIYAFCVVQANKLIDEAQVILNGKE